MPLYQLISFLWHNIFSFFGKASQPFVKKKTVFFIGLLPGAVWRFEISAAKKGNHVIRLIDDLCLQNVLTVEETQTSD